MNYNDFLKLAKRLKDMKCAEEVEFRTSISRAFNYTFISIRTKYWHDKRVNFIGGMGDKKRISTLLKKAKKSLLASNWRDLSNQRNFADYDMRKTFRKKNANEYIRDAENFVHDVTSQVSLERR